MADELELPGDYEDGDGMATQAALAIAYADPPSETVVPIAMLDPVSLTPSRITAKCSIQCGLCCDRF